MSIANLRNIPKYMTNVWNVRNLIIFIVIMIIAWQKIDQLGEDSVIQILWSTSQPLVNICFFIKKMFGKVLCF